MSTVVKEFVMPTPYVGEIVLFRLGKDSEPEPAVVSKVGTRSISARILAGMVRLGQFRDGIRHSSDPEVDDPNKAHDGIWSFTEERNRYELLSHQIKEVSELLEATGKKLDDLSEFDKLQDKRITDLSKKLDSLKSK